MHNKKIIGFSTVLILSFVSFFVYSNKASQDNSIVINLTEGKSYAAPPFTLEMKNIKSTEKVELKLKRSGLTRKIQLEYIETKDSVSTFTLPLVGAGDYTLQVKGRDKLNFKVSYYEKEVNNYKDCLNPDLDQSKEISCFRQYILSNLNKPDDVEQALKDVLTVAESYSDSKSPETNFRCHLFMHWVGESTILAFKNLEDALKYDNLYICNKGYLHGVISASILNRNIDLIKKDVDQLCNYFKEYNEIRSCAHGIGHDFYSKFGNAKSAFDYCGMIKDDIFKIECAGGVSMKIGFDYLERQPAELKNNPNLINEICAQVSAKMRSGCYRFVFLVYNSPATKSNLAEIFAKVCNNVTGADNVSCWAGAGIEYTTQNPDLEIKKLWDFCNIAVGESMKECITGAIFYRLQQFNVPTAKDYCKLASNLPKGKEYCEFWNAREKERIPNFGNVYKG